MKKSILVLALAAISAGAAAASADVVQFGQTVANKGDSPATLFFGTGNLADNFTTSSPSTGSPITLGLRAQIAGVPNFFDVSGPLGTYSVPAGDRPGFTNRATWDYDYSIDLGEGKGVTDSFANYTALLTITDDVTHVSTSYNPLTFGDNDETTGSTPTYEGPADHLVEQNGESPSFSLATQVDTNTSALDDYTVTLQLFNSPGGTLVASDTINIDVVAPLPASAWSGLALLGGLAVVGGIKRARRQIA
jgi:hypothetical protein